MEGHNLTDYYDLSESFSWDDIYSSADWDAPDQVNIAHETCDRHARDREKVALYHLDKDGEKTVVPFWEISKKSNQFANFLDNVVDQGDRVFSYMPRIPEHYIGMVGTLKAGCVWGSINERYGPEGIEFRLKDCNANVVFTNSSNRDVVDKAISNVDSVEYVVVVSKNGRGLKKGDISYYSMMNDQPKTFDVARTSGDDNALLYYTSGTTGKAKGVLHKHRWVFGVSTPLLYSADLQPSDLYWSTSDLGWMSGAANSLGTWFLGRSLFTYQGRFDAEIWADILDSYPISVLFSVPTAYRMLRENEELLEDVDLDIRHALSVGEPISSSLVKWSERVLGVTIHDTYGQTETGSRIINNYPTLETRPGSMGKPLPGVSIEVIDGDTGKILDTGETGQIGLRGDFPSFFDSYWNKPEKTESCFIDGWYLTGDLAHKDSDGYFWYEGRADDVIISSGYRIGPFEVESCLDEHPSVAETAVVPKPDEERGNIVKAYIVVSEEYDKSPSLKEKIKDHVKKELAAHEYPREIEFVDDLPKTVTGKIQRTELKTN